MKNHMKDHIEKKIPKSVPFVCPIKNCFNSHNSRRFEDYDTLFKHYLKHIDYDRYMIGVQNENSKDDTNILENKKVESKISKRCYNEKLMDTANVTNNSAEPAIQGMICKYPIFIPFTKKLYVSKI